MPLDNATDRVRIKGKLRDMQTVQMLFLAALLGGLVFALIPAFQATALLATIDGAYAACWGAACLAGLPALERGSRGAWLALGAAIGIGFLFKYTILLLLPGLLSG